MDNELVEPDYFDVPSQTTEKFSKFDLEKLLKEDRDLGEEIIDKNIIKMLESSQSSAGPSSNFYQSLGFAKYTEGSEEATEGLLSFYKKLQQRLANSEKKKVQKVQNSKGRFGRIKQPKVKTLIC